MTSRSLRHSLSALAPLICAVHCAATPLLVALMPALELSHAVEQWLFVASVPLVGWSLLTGFRVHGDLRPALLTVVGLAMWGGLLAHLFVAATGEWPLVAAALVTVVGLVWNARRRHLFESNPCPCASCGHPDAE